MTTAVTPTTELEAVNLMLDVIGESPISSLNDSAVVDAVKAKAVLSEVSRAVQQKGWHFNTEKDYELVPTVFEKEIQLPGNFLRVDTVGPDKATDVVQRGNRLYDRRKHTYKFDKSLKVDMVVLLPFEELPEAARYYIAVRAARVFQARTVGSESLYQFTAEDERLALVDLKKAEGVTGDHNMFTGSWSVAKMLNRR
ncbi:tail tubular protein A [Bordetella phage vB_BbrP_BB8]|uniref:Tail tubular protein A n=1 Tax=Bordetella phage vB_BbrP_BB8 TaxID=2587820 RepID=A0A4Y5TR04_9CAUD|nr:tail tubular protein A [Bordetella phage vB_BbrP_BB8]